MPNLPVRLTIPKTTTARIPGRFVFVDTETHPTTLDDGKIRHDLILGCARLWVREGNKRRENVEDYDFTSPGEFWSWLADKIHVGETLHVYAHNVSFDFMVLDGFRELPALGFTLKSIYHKFTTTIIRFSRKTRRVVFADTMNFYPVALGEIAKSLGMEKIAVDFGNVTAERLLERCRVDVEIIYKAVRNIVETIERENLGSFRPTAPGLALAAFRSRFMSHTIVTNHHPQVVEFERQAYTGGYIAVNRLVAGGDPALYKLDVNAMYPAVMRDELYPVQLTDFATNPKMEVIERLLKNSLAVAHVTVKTSTPLYPHRYETGTCYPVGEFKTRITTPLLLHAMQTGDLVKIHEVALYEKRPIFKEYIESMYAWRLQAREAGDLAGELFYKTLCNSLYGKFGQGMTQSKRVGDCDPDEFSVMSAYAPATGKAWRELHAGGSVIFITAEGESRWCFYAIAAHVTDYARLKLFDIIQQAGRENVYYLDTDAVIVGKAGAERLKDRRSAAVLGMLKTEDTGDALVAWAKKDYILGSDRKLKGFTLGETPPPDGRFAQMQSIKLYGAMRRELTGGAYWQPTNKAHRPYLRDAHLGEWGDVVPLDLPKDAGRLGAKVYTKEAAGRLAKVILTDHQLAQVKPWL